MHPIHVAISWFFRAHLKNQPAKKSQYVPEDSSSSSSSSSSDSSSSDEEERRKRRKKKKQKKEKKKDKKRKASPTPPVEDNRTRDELYKKIGLPGKLILSKRKGLQEVLFS